MSNNGGVLFVVAERSREWHIEEAVNSRGSFTDDVAVDDFKLPSLCVALLSLDGEHLRWAALARRGRPTVTGKESVRFFDLIKLDKLAFAEVVAALEPKYQRHADGAWKIGGKCLQEKTWLAVWEAVKSLRPAVADDLCSLQERARWLLSPSSAQGWQVEAMEKDAVSIALEIFGLGRDEVLRRWVPPPMGQRAPFLTGLGQFRLMEDQMIAHDATVFGDWSPMLSDTVGVWEFGKGNQRLTIFNANRGPVEAALGVDLLYYNHTYRAYVLVQYKAMGVRTKSAEAEFRPDTQTDVELDRMRCFTNNNPDPGCANESVAYRLHPGPFFMKLCPRVQYKTTSASLIKGMYIPLDFYDLLVSSGAVTGSRGGTVFTHQAVGRYITNEQFVDLLKRGWIGSRGPVSEVVTLATQQALAGRDVIVAVSSDGNARLSNEIENSTNHLEQADDGNEWEDESYPGDDFTPQW
jgi:hypothetical protein